MISKPATILPFAPITSWWWQGSGSKTQEENLESKGAAVEVGTKAECGWSFGWGSKCGESQSRSVLQKEQ